MYHKAAANHFELSYTIIVKYNWIKVRRYYMLDFGIIIKHPCVALLYCITKLSKAFGSRVKPATHGMLNTNSIYCLQ